MNWHETIISPHIDTKQFTTQHIRLRTHPDVSNHRLRFVKEILIKIQTQEVKGMKGKQKSK